MLRCANLLISLLYYMFNLIFYFFSFFFPFQINSSCHFQGCSGSKDNVRVAPSGAGAVRIGKKAAAGKDANDMMVEGE